MYMHFVIYHQVECIETKNYETEGNEATEREGESGGIESKKFKNKDDDETKHMKNKDDSEEKMYKEGKVKSSHN